MTSMTTIQIPEDEMTVTFIRSAGPGGQNVNKVASAVQLRFDVHKSNLLTEEIKQRLIRIAGKRMTEDGVLVIEARRYREQDRNRQDAIDRLHHLIEKASMPPIKRLPTRPTSTSVRNRLEDKKRRSDLKRSRRSRPEEHE